MLNKKEIKNGLNLVSVVCASILVKSFFLRPDTTLSASMYVVSELPQLICSQNKSRQRKIKNVMAVLSIVAICHSILFFSLSLYHNLERRSQLDLLKQSLNFLLITFAPFLAVFLTERMPIKSAFKPWLRALIHLIPTFELSSNTAVLVQSQTTFGQAYCWGSNAYGELGNASIAYRTSFPSMVNTTALFSEISSASFATCAIDLLHQVQCWGANWFGQVGLNSSTRYDSPRLTDVSAKEVSIRLYHACARNSLNIMQCWGNNQYGQLGDGSTLIKRDRQSVVDLPPVSAITTGAYHTCAITQGGELNCWGRNDFGQLGDGTYIDKYFPAPLRHVGSPVNAIASGFNHVCAIINHGVVICWGDNRYGQLSLSTRSSRNSSSPIVVPLAPAKAIAAGGRQTCAILTSGSVFCWGGTYGETPTHIPVFTNAAKISAGFYHQCVTEAGKLYCWGGNSAGQLGVGGTAPSTEPAQVIFGNKTILNVSTGDFHTCALAQ